jgi:hypothetical protein
MSDQSWEVLSALVDGERIDSATLRAALSQPGAIDALIDFVALRGEVDQLEEREPISPVVLSQRSRWSPQLWAAAALAVAFLGGYFLGDRHAEVPAATGDTPPTATRTLHFDENTEWIRARGQS